MGREMRRYLEKLPKDTQQLISLISRIAENKKMSVYLVGGFVRDLILGVNNFDLDIVVEGNGIILAEELSRILKAGFIRHHRFGTATLSLKEDIKIDISTARRESYPEPGCLPSVDYATIKEDLSRRDFTINAMAISINQEDSGSLVDFFGGRRDLKNKYIRVLHKKSFIDDPTRMLRAIRFEQRFNFRIEPRSLKFLKNAASEKRLQTIQPQRIRDELILDLKEPNPLRIIKRIDRLLGFEFLHHELRLDSKVSDILRRIYKNVRWYSNTCPKRRRLDVWLIYLMGLLDSLSLEAAKSLCRSFVFRKGEEKRILSAKGIKSPFITQLSSKSLNPPEIFNLLEPLSYEVIIFIISKYKNPVVFKHVENFLEIYNGMRLCISGDDLSRLGLSPGPYYRKIFTKVLEVKLQGRIKSKEEELDLIKKLTKIK